MKKLRFAVTSLIVAALVGCGTTTPPTPSEPVAAASPAAPAEAPPAPTEWGPAFATAGTRLALEDRGATTVNGKRAVSYGFAASGYPTDKTYTVWTRTLAGRVLMLDTLRADQSGVLVTERGVPFGKQTFNLYSLSPGEPVDFALLSQDQTVRAFARVVPFPLQARDNNGCTLAIEMLAADGKQFGVRASGFQPNEDVINISKVDDQTKQQKFKASAAGSFVNIVDMTQSTRGGGTASYQVTGKRCKVNLNYDWGTAIRRL